MHSDLVAALMRRVLPYLVLLPATAGAASLAEAVAGGKPNLDLRLRYERIETNPPYGPGITEDQADALTARLRLGYTTAQWHALDAQAEFSGTWALDDDHYQSTDNLKSRYPIVPDPSGETLNQAWLRYSGLPATTITLGRQRLAYDNQRFIGNVAWRQREQTFDAVSLSSQWLGRWLPQTTFNYAYLSRVQAFRAYRMDPANAGVSCNADFACADTLGLNGHALNLAWVAAPALKLVGYGYWLDFDFDSAARRDTRTLGLRAMGTVPVDAFKLSYTLEYADQRGIAESPSGLKADYQLIELGAARGPVAATLGHEVLSGDGAYGFQTPLATLHAFQGWVDLFVNTPVWGVRDDAASLSLNVERAKLTAVWHRYAADSASLRYGDEWNLLATRPIGKQLNAGLKYGIYDGNRESPDAPRRSRTEKFWAWLEYKL